MALGDNDITSGVFFSDFADVVTFGGRSVNGNVDGGAKDGVFSGVSVSDIEYRVEITADAFSPMPMSKDRLTIDTGRYAGAYAVRCVDPLDDGATVEVKLRKL